MTFRSNFRAIGLTLGIFLMPLFLYTYLLLIALSNTGNLGQTGFIPELLSFFAFTSIFTLPGLLLHIRYYRQDKNKAIYFGKEQVEWTDKNGTVHISYTEMIKVEKHYLYWQYRNPWAEYGYITIMQKNGTVIRATSLTCNVDSVAAFFKSKKVVLENVEEVFPW